MGPCLATVPLAMFVAPLFGLFTLTSTQSGEPARAETHTVAIDVGGRAPDRANARIGTVEEDAISVDGKGDERAWSELPAYGDFIQSIPAEGQPASERTLFKVAHDEDALYILIEALDSRPGTISAHLTRRDADSTSDWVHVWLDPFDARRAAYRFSVNAAGVKQDARVQDNVDDDLNWNAVWAAEVSTSSIGWSAEMRIPLSELRYTEGADRWGFEVGRDLVREKERSYFSPVPRGTSRIMQHFGALGGVESVPGKIDASLTPYVSGSFRQNGSEPNPDDRTSFKPTAGGDGHLGLGSALVLDVTVNPDFAQVEADPSELNLTTTETFFEEKRPFFIAGKDVLSYGIGFGDGDLGRHTLFYSRRVGRERVLGAAKLTGRSPDGWSLGVLNAVVDGGGSDDDPREPLANASVLRATQDYSDGQGKIGLIATHLYRNLNDARTLEESLEHASTFGVDLDQQAGDYQLQLRAYGSRVSGSPSAVERVQRSFSHNFQRPDAEYVDVDPTRTSMLGWGFSAIAQKNDGKNWRGAVGVEVTNPYLELNPLGYLPLSDRQIGFAWLQLRGDDPTENYQSYSVNFNFTTARTFGEELTTLGGNVNGSIITPFWWEFFTGLGRDQSILDPSRLRGGPALKVPGDSFGWVGFLSDERKPFSALFEMGMTSGDGDKYKDWYLYLKATVKPSSWLEFQLIPQFSRRILDYQYVDEFEDRAVLARIERQTFTVAARANWTINPDLSVQLYASPYITAGEYFNFRFVTNPRAERYADRFGPATGYDGDDAVKFAEIRGNLVVRWEYALGSTAFFVWSHGQTNEENTRGSRTVFDDFGPLLDAASDDVLLVKVDHRLDW